MTQDMILLPAAFTVEPTSGVGYPAWPAVGSTVKAAGSSQPASQWVWQYFKFPRFGARQGSLPHSSAHALLFSQLTYARPCFLMSCLTCPRCDQQRRLNSRRSNHLAKCLHRIRARSSWLEAVWLGAPSMTWPKAHWVGGSGGRRRCATKASFRPRFFISARRCPRPAQQTPLNFHRATWRANCLHFIRTPGAKKTSWLEAASTSSWLEALSARSSSNSSSWLDALRRLLRQQKQQPSGLEAVSPSVRSMAGGEGQGKETLRNGEG